MQLDNAAILPYIEADVVSAWSLEQLRNAFQHTENAANQLPKARIEMQAGASQGSGGAAASPDVLMPHTYHITGIFAYPSPPSTILEAQAERWNQLVALLTADYPRYHDLWQYSEEIGWDFDDDPAERTYSVTVIFTVNVIAPVKMISVPGP